MDDELKQLIKEISEIPTTSETLGIASDNLLDQWIMIARQLKNREGI